MTTTTKNALPLLDSIEQRSNKREAAAAATRGEALQSYWTTIGAIADGDPSGGSDAGTFAKALADAGVTTAQARADLHDIARCREAVAMRDELRAAQQQARAEVEAAEDARRIAKAAADAAERDATHASWRHTDAGQKVTAVEMRIRDELPDVANDLRRRGFKGELLPPPRQPAPPRRWRLKNRSNATGNWTEPGTELDLPAHVCLSDGDAELVGPVTPEMGPPRVVLVPVVQQEGERPRIDRAPMLDSSPSGAAVERHCNPPNNVVTA